MRDYIWKRVLDVANHILTTRQTVRDAARKFGVSKSTIHKDVTERLPRINPALAERVKAVLEENKSERHIRGGESTRRKYRLQGKGFTF
ncbi:MAG: sporulation transcriptional regulator SpoIIID [Bacillota bacterium]